MRRWYVPSNGSNSPATAGCLPPPPLVTRAPYPQWAIPRSSAAPTPRCHQEGRAALPSPRRLTAARGTGWTHIGDDIQALGVGCRTVGFNDEAGWDDPLLRSWQANPVRDPQVE